MNFHLEAFERMTTGAASRAVPARRDRANRWESVAGASMLADKTGRRLGRRTAATAEKGYPLRSAAAKRSTIAAAGSTSVIAPTLWPAYIAIASMSPFMPASGMLAP